MMLLAVTLCWLAALICGLIWLDIVTSACRPARDHDHLIPPTPRSTRG